MTPLILLGAIALCFVAFANWRRGIAVLALWLLVEGTIRRLIPERGFIVYFVKDLLVVAVLLGYAHWRFNGMRVVSPATRRPPWPIVAVPAFLLLALGIVQAVNPTLPSYFTGAIGLKVYFLYMPLIAVGFHLFRSDALMSRSIALYSLTSVIVLAVAILQIFRPSGAFIPDAGALYLYRVHSTHLTNLVLPTSIFVGELRFANHALLCMFLSIGLIGFAHAKRHRQRSLGILGAIGAAASFGAVIVTGKNLAILLASVLGAVVLLALRAKSRSLSPQERRFPALSIFAGVIAIISGLLLAMPERTRLLADYMVYRIQSGELEANSASDVVRELARIRADHGSLGTGLGRYTQGAETLGRFEGFHDPRAFLYHEGTIPKVVIETGVLGGILWIWLALGTVGLSLAAMRRTAKTRHRPLAIGMFAYVVGWFVYAWKAHQVADDPFQLIPLWLIVGILVSLGYRTLTQHESAAADGMVPARPPPNGA